MDIVSESFAAGQRVLERRSSAARKLHGQFLTPPLVARFLADQLGALPESFSILDPAAGSGTLLCAVIERLINENVQARVRIEAFEIDPALYEVTVSTLERARLGAAKRGIDLDVHVHCGDYVLAEAERRQPTLFTSPDDTPLCYDRIIANPPYFKLNSDDPRVTATRPLVGAHTNIYTLFMALAVDSLAPSGKSAFLVPRSFCSGAYFAHFREELARRTTIDLLHLFESRGDNFDEVLQENVIIAFSQRDPDLPQAAHIAISSSQNGTDSASAEAQPVATSLVLHRRDRALFYRLPTDPDDELILRAFDAWTGSLQRYGMEVSTGRVVAFRAENHLEQFADENTVPLLWMQHVRSGAVRHPLPDLRKPQWIRRTPDSAVLLVPASNYVLLRRFSAKEEARRLVAGAFLRADQSSEMVGFENHLNVIHRRQGALSDDEAHGLAALYNSAPFDRYFRITNGNTQVNAAELRAMPLPPLDVIRAIGAVYQANPLVPVDHLVLEHLTADDLLPADLLLIEKN
ncbi:MAG: N-6 DNA methylase [Chloroflexota bacterium]|nr:N-6 DNA methylase [Chloroflexota bacterium]